MLRNRFVLPGGRDSPIQLSFLDGTSQTFANADAVELMLEEFVAGGGVEPEFQFRRGAFFVVDEG